MAHEFIDNTPIIKRQLEAALKGILDDVGNRAVSDVVSSITAKGLTGGTGDLKQSITHIVKDKEVHIGSALEYAVYHEFGTGVHAENGKGRKGWWVYVKGGGKKGSNTHKTYSYEEARQIMAILRSQVLDAHMTQGVRASHFLKEAVESNLSEYNRMLENGIAGAIK